MEISKTNGGKKYVLSVLEPGKLLDELRYLGVIRDPATARAMGRSHSERFTAPKHADSTGRRLTLLIR
jgi:hypothetical protein